MGVLTLIIFFLCGFSALALSAENYNVENRIVGGEIARSGQFPFVAAVYISTNAGSYFCGGTIVTNFWILTAAYCLEGGVLYTIQLGSHLLNGVDTHRVTVSTATSEVHPEYNGFTLQNDVALIKLRLQVSFNDWINRINLPSAPLADGATATAVGWGQLSDVTSGLTEELNFVSLITITNAQCNAFFSSEIFDTMACVAGNNNQGTCIGDNGAPLIQYSGITNVAVQVGLASFLSENGCQSTDPSGFTRIYPFIDWINAVTET